MKANELRIGNIIGYSEVDLDSGCEIIKNYPCTLRDIAEIERGNIFNRYSLVLLTESWIRKNCVCQEYFADGIDIDIYDFIIILEGQYLIGHDKETNSWYFVQELTESFDSSTFLSAVSAPMKFVHTLQNYFPTISGTELQIK